VNSSSVADLLLGQWHEAVACLCFATKNVVQLLCEIFHNPCAQTLDARQESESPYATPMERSGANAVFCKIVALVHRPCSASVLLFQLE